MSLLSVIVPCYNEEESVSLFYEELIKNEPFFQEKEMEVEILYVDDGSRDRTVEEIKKLRERDKRVRMVSFPVTSARKLQCTPVWSIPEATWWC